MPEIDFTRLTRTSQMQGDCPEDTELLRAMLSKAEAYLKGFPWCRSIVGSYFGLGVGGIFGVFLFRIEPASPEVDSWLWVVVGDLPPAYLVTNDIHTAQDALDAYIYHMDCWVSTVRRGESTEECIPVNGAPTLENATALDSRLKFLSENFLHSEPPAGTPQ